MWWNMSSSRVVFFACDSSREDSDSGQLKEEAPYGDGLVFYVQEEWANCRPFVASLCGG